jgi:hypothetical protein
MQSSMIAKIKKRASSAHTLKYHAPLAMARRSKRAMVGSGGCSVKPGEQNSLI